MRLSHARRALALFAHGCAAMLALAPLHRADAQVPSITGLVYDTTRTGAAAEPVPLVGVEVELLASVTSAVAAKGLTATTDTAGAFHFNGVAAGTYLLRFHHGGFRPVQRGVAVTDGVTAEVVAFMAPDTRAIVARTGETSSARLAGFEKRRRSGRGSFLTREQIERRHATNTTDLLRTMPGVIVRDTVIQGERTALIVSSRGANVSHALATSCQLRTIVDERLMPEGYPLNEINVAEVIAVEVYPGAASIPASFASFGGSTWCGLVVIRRDDGT